MKREKKYSEQCFYFVVKVKPNEGYFWFSDIKKNETVNVWNRRKTYNWYEVVLLFNKECKCNDTAIVTGYIYAAQKRNSSAKHLNWEKNGVQLHFGNVDLWRHSPVYSLP